MNEVRITDIDLSFFCVFKIVFRVVLSLFIIGAVTAIIVMFIRLMTRPI